MNTRPGIATLALAALATVEFGIAAEVGQATTTVYVGRHFEVRDHDQPVKYVFDGVTRVARITGSLSNNPRVQRLRLQPGWNHCAVAVGDAKLPARVEIDQAYRWNSVTGQYELVGVQDSLAAGTVLWIKANAPAVISVTGTYLAPTPTTWPAGKTFVGGTGLEAMSLTLPPGVTVWKFEATSQSWRAGLAGDLASVKELPPKLVPGEAIYVHAPEPIAAPLPNPEQRIAYYHQDHLGSSSVVTDATGVLLEETAYYPFGGIRYEHRPQAFEANYGFTQKERDRESGLHYFEARYLAGSLARFISLDPKFLHPDALSAPSTTAFLSRPQKHNPFAYALNNPLMYTDPTGLDQAKAQRQQNRTADRGAESKRGPDPVVYGPALPPVMETVLILKGSEGETLREISIKSFSLNSSRPPSEGTATAKDDPTGGGDVGIIKALDKTSSKLQESAIKGTHYKEATIVVRTKGPNSTETLRVKLSDVFISAYQFHPSQGEPAPSESLTLNAGKREMIFPSGSQPTTEPQRERSTSRQTP